MGGIRRAQASDGFAHGFSFRRLALLRVAEPFRRERRHGQGHDRDRVFRALDAPSRAGRRRARQNDDARAYAELFEKIKPPLTVNLSRRGPDRRNTQTAYALALQFDLLPKRSVRAVRRLAADVHARGNHLSTDFWARRRFVLR